MKAELCPDNPATRELFGRPYEVKGVPCVNVHLINPSDVSFGTAVITLSAAVQHVRQFPFDLQ
jgi:hypothetical protein